MHDVERGARPAWSALADALPDALVLVDAEARLVDANPAAQRMFGHSLDAMLGRSTLSLVHPDDLWEAADSMRTTLERTDGAGIPITLRVCRADGTWLPVELIGNNRLHDPDVCAVVLSLRDVSGRTDLVQALDASERRFHTVVRHASEVVLLLDGEGIIRYASPALVPATGWQPEEILGTTGLDKVHPDDLERIVEEVTPVFLTPGGRFRAEYRLRNRAGEWRWCEALCVNMLGDPAVDRVAMYVRDITERREMEDALASSERRFRSLVAHSSDVTVVYAADGTITYVSPSVRTVMGYDDRAALGLKIRDFVHPDDLRSAHDWLHELLGVPGAAQVREIRMRHADGSWKTFDVNVTNLTEDPAVGGLVANARDVTDRKQAERARHESDERFASAFENAPIGMALQDLDGRFLMVNQALCDLLGYGRERLLEFDGLELTHPDDREEQLRLRQRLVSGEVRAYQHEKRYVRSDGRIVWAKLSVSTIDDADGRPSYVIAQIEDVTGRRRDEARLTHQALHDALTGLPNRALLLDRLAVALERARRGGPLVGVLFCDLDRFKVVNDSDGHQVGDRLLVACAERLREIVRHGDTIARFGGDEFVVLCTELDARDEAVALARRLAEVLEAPFTVDGKEFFVTTSIGIAFSGGGESADDLLRDADAAMYRAKERGRASFAVFEPEMRSLALRRAETERLLRRAIELGELRLHYQPLVRLADSRLVGAEALVRWLHPERGLIPPAEFVPLAEDTGLILGIGRWVAEEACNQLAAWERDGLIPSDFVLTVNLSLRQLTDPGLVDDVTCALRASGVAARRLCFEVTESALADDGALAERALLALRTLGVGLAIDDFGTGYSALSHLKRFPFDTIKIDRTFVDGLGRDPEDEAIVAAIIGIARALGLDLIGEGIETPEQAAALRARGVEVGQGFLYGPGVPAELFATLLALPAA